MTASIQITQVWSITALPRYLTHTTLSHSILLLRPLQLRNPPRSLRSKQLNIRLTSLQNLRTQNSSLHNLHTREILSISEKSRSTITAEVGRDLLAAISGFGVGFGVAGYAKAFAGYDIVDAESAAADFLAVGAVAECLFLGLAV